jgi:hypothetical protein
VGSGSQYSEDTGNNDEGRFINLIHPASGAPATAHFGLYIKGGSLVQKFQNCRFFGGPAGDCFVSIPYVDFHDCVFTGTAPVILSGTFTVPCQVAFTGHTYWNGRTSPNLQNNTPATTWFVGFDNLHGGVSTTALPSSTGLFSGGGFFIVGASLHFNVLTGTHLFDTADVASVLLGAFLLVRSGSLIYGSTTITGSNNEIDAGSKGAWKAYHN